MVWIKRKDRFYSSLKEVLSSYRYKELSLFYGTIGFSYRLGANIFSKDKWNEFHKEMRSIIYQYEPIPKIKYREFRDLVVNLICNKVNEEIHVDLIQLALELFNKKEQKEALLIACRIFNLDELKMLDLKKRSEKGLKQNEK